MASEEEEEETSGDPWTDNIKKAVSALDALTRRGPIVADDETIRQLMVALVATIGAVMDLKNNVDFQ
jgi:hypothetical protein